MQEEGRQTDDNDIDPQPHRITRKPVTETGPAARLSNEDEGDTDSQQEFEDINPSIEHPRHPNWLNFELMTPGSGHLPDGGRTRSDPTGRVALRPVSSGDSTSEVDRNAGRLRGFSLEIIHQMASLVTMTIPRKMLRTYQRLSRETLACITIRRLRPHNGWGPHIQPQ